MTKLSGERQSAGDERRSTPVRRPTEEPVHDNYADQIDRLIAWHAPVAHLADWAPPADRRLATVDLSAAEEPARSATG
jgi:hypothetical protein